MSNGKNEQEINRDEVEEALQNGLEDIQSAVVEPYFEIVKTAVEDVLKKAGLDEAQVTEVSVKPPDYIVPSQNSKCFPVYVPRVGHVTICIPVPE
jgi:hypothetical protein